MRNLLRGSGGVLVFLGAGLLVERPSHWALTDGSRVVTRVGPAWQPAVRICRVSCDVPPPMTRAACTLGRGETPGYQRKSFCVKRLVGASSVVCPCIAVMGGGPQLLATSPCSTPAAVAPSWSTSVRSILNSTRRTGLEVDIAR